MPLINSFTIDFTDPQVMLNVIAALVQANGGSLTLTNGQLASSAALLPVLQSGSNTTIHF